MHVVLIQSRANLYKELPIEGINRICEPLGLGYVGAVAKQAGHNIRIIHQIRDSDEEVIRKTLDFSPYIVGFSVMTLERKKALDLAKRIKTQTCAKIIFGGPDTIGNPEIILDDAVDFLFVGEGEYSLTSLLDRLEKKETEYSGILGLVYKNDGQIKINHPKRIEDLDSLPFPLREDLQMSLYKQYLPSSLPTSKQRFATIINSRGCYHTCNFCLNAPLWGSIKISRSANNVVDEVEHLKQKHGVNLIWLWDPNPQTKDLYEISNEILKRNVKIKWQSFLNPGEADLSLYQLMHDSGYELAVFGIESGNDKQLAAMHKSTTKEKTADAIVTAKRAGFFIHGTYIVGYPDETKEEFLQSFNFLKKLKKLGLESLSPFFATPLKGTLFYELCKERDLIIDHNPDHYDLVHPVIKTKLMEEWRDYGGVRSWCQKNFYYKSQLKMEK